MSLTYKFNGAKRIIRRLDTPERETLNAICQEIYSAQRRLVQASHEPLGKCIHSCEGLCCKNVRVDNIIGTPDFIYLLTVAPHMGKRIEARLPDEKPMYSADCIFLQNGTGPCMFPEGVRPEVCVTTFCGDHRSVRKEISRLKRKFFKLDAFIRLRRPHRLFRALCSLGSGNASDLSLRVLCFLAIPIASL